MRQLMKFGIAKLLATALCLTLIASPASTEERPLVITVNYAIKYFAERLLGNTAEVRLPVPADTDPSFWRPSIADISAIQNADLILLNGAGFATWVDRVSLPRSRVANTSAAIENLFIVTESITHSHGDGGEHSHEGLASYLWLDPTLAIAQAEAIASAVKRKGLMSSDEVDVALASFVSELNALDSEISKALDGLENITLIATHPRYEYFARRYGLTIESLEWEAGAMPNAEQLDALANLKDNIGASVLIWEGPPPEAAIDAALALGLQSAVFPPLAHAPSDLDYIATMAKAANDVAEAARAAGL